MKRALRTALFISVVCSLLPTTVPASAATKASLVRVTMTSSWPTKSPDPMGLAYNPRAKRLLISDAEVDEMPALWKGKNLFVAKRGGGLTATGTFKKFTHEPEDLAWDNAHQVLYVTDDDLDSVFRVGRGKDKRLGTRDDVVVTVLHTHRFGSFDPEGLAWLGSKRMLILSDSTNRRVYKIRPGKDLKFGTRDDTVRSFGTHKYGFTTAEDVAVRGKHLFIVSSRQRFILETTMKGGLIQKIDLTGLGIVSASGIIFAPGTDGGRSRLYLTASGVDNNVNPNQNDGRLFELKFVKTP
jgi:sugar lactone lactonase YvrE